MAKLRQPVFIGTVCLSLALSCCTTWQRAWADAPQPDADAWLAAARVAAPPEALKLDPFYRKHVDVLGMPVVASENVHDAALLEAGYWVYRMLENQPDVARAIAGNGVRLAV